MKKKRYTEEQITFALRQSEAGTPVAEVIRKMGISEQKSRRPTSDVPRSLSLEVDFPTFGGR